MPQTDFFQFPSMGTYTVAKHNDLIIMFSKYPQLPTILSLIYKNEDKDTIIPFFSIDYLELQRIVEESGIKIAHHGMHNFNIRESEKDKYDLYYGDHKLLSYKYFSVLNQIFIYTINESGVETRAAFICMSDEYDNEICYNKLNESSSHIMDSTFYYF